MKAIFFALFAFLAISTLTVQVQAQDCGTCELVIQFVEQWVESNATESEILQYLDTLCAFFPSYATTCDSIAQQSLAQILAWIAQNETPEQICTQMGLCTSAQVVSLGKFMINIGDLKKIPALPVGKPMIATKPAVTGAECGGCETVISTIEQWLDQSNNQQEVIQAVEVVCTYMPGWETTCDAIIAAGVPAVVQWIDEYENATQVCAQLGLCSATKVQVIHVTDDCGECSQIVAFIANWVAQSATETEIESYLTTVCSLVPQFSSVCTSSIQTYLPEIISYIEQSYTPAQVCAKIGLCTANKSMKLN